MHQKEMCLLVRKLQVNNLFHRFAFHWQSLNCDKDHMRQNFSHSYLQVDFSLPIPWKTIELFINAKGISPLEK